MTATQTKTDRFDSMQVAICLPAEPAPCEFGPSSCQARKRHLPFTMWCRPCLEREIHEIAYAVEHLDRKAGER